MSRRRSRGSRTSGARAACAALAGALALVFAAPGPGAELAGVAVAEAGEREAQVERHLVLAQYYQLRKRDLDAAAAEYRRVLDRDRNHAQAARAR